MNDTCEARAPSAGVGQTTAPLAFAGPVGLIAGENAGSYDELLARVTAALKPADIMEEIWVRHMVDLVWETLRLRRLKASLLAVCAHEGVYKLLDVLDCEAPFRTSRAWLARNPAAVERVESTLASAGNVHGRGDGAGFFVAQAQKAELAKRTEPNPMSAHDR